MALRLIEIVVPEEKGEEIRGFLKDYKMVEYRQVQLPNKQVMVRILLDAEQNEAVLDILEKKYTPLESNRIVILPVAATLPRDETAPPSLLKHPLKRIGREELYEDIKDAAECSRVFLAMSVLSTFVAIVGLIHNSVAIIIGAMVIAPSIGPSTALAFSTTLGDILLMRRSLTTTLYWISITVMLSVAIGLFVFIDPTTAEVASRTQAGLVDLVVALAAGCAGTLGFTTGLSATLIGVMVAVSLLPPLVTFGLLLGGGQIALSLGALSLFLMNITCVNLASVITFLVQGIHPMTQGEKNRAAKTTRIAIGLWMILLVALVSLLLLLPKGLI